MKHLKNKIGRLVSNEVFLLILYFCVECPVQEKIVNEYITFNFYLIFQMNCGLFVVICHSYILPN